MHTFSLRAIVPVACVALFAPVSAARAQPNAAPERAVIGITRAEAQRPWPARRPAQTHPLFRTPAEVALRYRAPSTPPPPPWSGARGELRVLDEDGREQASKLLDRWRRSNPRDSYQRAVDQALAVPAADRRPPQMRTAWTEIGDGIHDPTHGHRTGRVRCAQYAHDVQQGMTTLFLGSMGGGLWRFEWGANRWQPVSAGLDGSPSVGAFVVDPNDPQHILIGTGDAHRYRGTGLHRSQDAGATWQQRSLSPTPDCFFRVLADVADPNVFLAAADTGIYRSDDGGDSWNHISYRSATDLVQDPVNPQLWYAGQIGVGVLRSDDGGQSFGPSNTGITGLVGYRVSVALCDAAPNYVYALVSDGNGRENGIYRSDDYGLKWVPIDLECQTNNPERCMPQTTCWGIGWGQAFHTNALVVHPADPDIVLCGMGGFKWTDNATAAQADVSWYRCRGVGHADHTSFTFIPGSLTPSSDPWVLATHDGGYSTYDLLADKHHTDGNLLGMNLAQVWIGTQGLAQSQTAANVLMAGLQDNGVAAIDVNAQPAVHHSYGGDGGKVAFSPNNKTDWFASIGGPPYGRYMSPNAGAGWWGINGPLPSFSVPSLLPQPFPGSTLMFTHEAGRYVHYANATAVNGGWRRVNNTYPLPSGTIVSAIDVAVSPDIVIYAAASNGELYLFDSSLRLGGLGRMAFAKRTPPLPAGSNGAGCVVTADRYAADTVYYVTGGARPSRAFRSLDRGRNWTDCTGDLVQLLPDAHYFELIGNPRDPAELFLATDVGVFSSTNGGQNWTRFMDAMPQVVDVRNLEFGQAGQFPVLRLASNGRGCWHRMIP